MPPRPDEPLALREQRNALPDLELPDAPDFISLPPRRSLAEMLPWMERMRKAFPQSMPTDAQRLARKVDVEFVL